jgi:pyruvate ferredoxin oxidoreductase beta subunit
MNKVKKAGKIKGPTFIHCMSVCPTGWRTASKDTIKMGRLAVETGVFPLYEIENGKYTMNVKQDTLRPIEDYLKLQGRFRHLTPSDIKTIQARVNLEYNKLLNKVEALKSWEDLG